MARSTKPQDSLDLLLDTMCNAFGGIIMIALLVALLIKDAKHAEKGPSDAVQASMAGRKLTQVRAELTAAKALEDELKARLAQSGDIAKKIEERDALQRQLDEITARTSAAESVLKSTPERTEARSKNEAIEREKAATQRAISELEKNAKELSEKLTRLEKALADARSKRTIELGPPPAVRETTKVPFNLIFRYNRLYPLVIPAAGNAARNETDVRWTPNGDSAEAAPIPGAGIDADRNEAAVREFISRLNGLKSSLKGGGELYVASYVYPDSFPAYLRFKKLWTEAKTGIGHGWEPVPKDNELSFGNTGFKPGVQ